MGSGGAETLGHDASALPAAATGAVLAEPPHKGARVWTDVCGSWALGTVLAARPDAVSVVLDEDGRQLDGVAAAAVLPANPPGFDIAADLTSLSHLHHPALLHALRARYDASAIHTWAGPVLVVLNPYRPLAGAYGEPAMAAAAARSAGAERRAEGEPHTFLVADAAYQRMVEYGQSQSILVSGGRGGSMVARRHGWAGGAHVSAPCLRHAARTGCRLVTRNRMHYASCKQARAVLERRRRPSMCCGTWRGWASAAAVPEPGQPTPARRLLPPPAPWRRRCCRPTPF